MTTRSVGAWRGLRQAVAFLTPVGGAVAPSPAALVWFGVVGAAVGTVVGLAWWGASLLVPLVLAAAVAVVVDLAVTGLLHVDGLADAADGLLPPLPTERRLAVMRDPNAGAFAVAAVAGTLLVRFAAFASLVPDGRAVLAVAALWSTSRAAMAVTASTVPYARAGGLATAFLTRPGGGERTTGSSGGTRTAHPDDGGEQEIRTDGGGRTARRWVWPVAALVPLAAPALALALLGGSPPLRGLLAVAAAGLGAAVVVAFARGRIGGFTGDVLGAAGVVAETAGLVLLAVRP